jgi:hypothetical protein
VLNLEALSSIPSMAKKKTVLSLFLPLWMLELYVVFFFFFDSVAMILGVANGSGRVDKPPRRDEI